MANASLEICDETRHTAMQVRRINIDWKPTLPIFASEPFLKSVSDDYGWLGGISASGELCCVLPFTILRRTGISLARFRVQTIPIQPEFSPQQERSFLNGVVTYLREAGTDIIIPATTNAVFRVYPDHADAAPYGSYILDLRVPEDDIWRGISRIMRQNIRTAQKDGVTIRDAIDRRDSAYELIRDTFRRSHMAFMRREEFNRYIDGLGLHAKLLVAEYRGAAQSYVLFAFSQYCAYAIYAGNLEHQHQGANKLLYWEAIRDFRNLGVRTYDFVGARINPVKGSKQDSINALKQRFGARLMEGYMWKMPLRPVRALAYTLAVRLLKGGDIVDIERHKLGSTVAAIPPTNSIAAAPKSEIR